MTELVDLTVPGRRTVAEWIGKTPDEPFPPRVRLRILLRFDRKCAECGRPIRPGRPWTCDHTIAIINGGENRERNGRPLCEFCVKPKDAADQAEKSRTAEIQKSHYGLKKPSRPMDGSRASPFKKRMDGTVLRRHHQTHSTET